MNANELRIGNFVRYKSDISGQEKDIEVEWNFFADDFWIKRSIPIPLTEEWLLKFGFIFRSNIDESIINLFENKIGYVIAQNTSGFYFQYPSLYAGDVRIQYVHQLQNLYFALTGNELELK